MSTTASKKNTAFETDINKLLENKNLSDQDKANAISEMLIRLYGGNTNAAYEAYLGRAPTSDEVKAFDAILAKGGVGGVKGAVPPALKGAMEFINKNSGLGEIDIADLARGVGLNYNPITDILFDPKSNQLTKVDTSKLGKTFYGADDPTTKEVENYQPGTPEYVQAFINRLAIDNPTLTADDFKTIATKGYGLSDTAFAADPTKNTLGSLTVGKNVYTIPTKASTTDSLVQDPLSTAGKAFTGENTGLRGPYVPFAGQALERVSALMAARQDPKYKPETFGETYGQDTSKTLKDLQTQRESMMSGDKAYTPFKYSFAPKPAAAGEATKPAAAGGVMSLVDHYDAGGAVGNTYTAQTVPSTFTAPTDKFSSSTYSSGYTAPTDMYTAGTISSGYTTPTDLYKGPGDAGITTGTATFDIAARDRLMNPYMSGVVDPATREAKRQSEIQGMTNAAKFTQAGAFGGTRNILAEAERQRNLATQLGDIYGRGQKEAYDAAQRAFEAEQGRALTAGVESERARQEAGRQGLSSAQTAAQLGLQAQTAQEQAKQAQGQQALSSAATAAQLGLDASKLTEQSKQFGAQYGLNVATTSAQYDQLARQLQQQAEEAQARGDQFAANLALQQLQEANRAAEASREFEYKQSRDQYLDPFREAGYMSQILSGLPMTAAGTGISPNLEALIAALGVNNLLTPGTKTSDRRLKTDIKPLGALHDGLTVYSYRYKSGGPVQVGVMADEVAILRPQAYIKGGAGDGFDAVDYTKL